MFIPDSRVIASAGNVLRRFCRHGEKFMSALDTASHALSDVIFVRALRNLPGQFYC